MTKNIVEIIADKFVQSCHASWMSGGSGNPSWSWIVVQTIAESKGITKNEALEEWRAAITKQNIKGQ